MNEFDEIHYKQILQETEHTLRVCADMCLSRPGFKVTVYIRSIDNIMKLKPIVDSIQADLDYCSFRHENDNVYFDFENGSKMQFIIMNNALLREESNWIVVDYDIEQVDIDSFIQPLIIPYTAAGIQINPKLFYILFTINNPNTEE